MKDTPEDPPKKYKKGHHPNSRKQLKTKPWVKGQSGNPKGRTEGTKTRKTILKELLELDLKRKNQESGKYENVAHPLDPNQKTITVEAAINAALIQRALKGDVRAIQEIQDTMYGKIKETQILENPDGSALHLSKGMTPADAAKAYQQILQRAKKGGDKK